VTDTSWLGPPIDVRPLFPRQQAAAALRIVSIIWSPPGLPDAD